MVCELAFQWELNTLEASNKIRYTKKTRLDMLASQVCMLEVGSIYMSTPWKLGYTKKNEIRYVSIPGMYMYVIFFVLHIVFGVLLAGEMHSQHMIYNNQNIYALLFFLVIDMVVWSTSKLS